jgi:hypothetical protein
MITTFLSQFPTRRRLTVWVQRAVGERTPAHKNGERQISAGVSWSQYMPNRFRRKAITFLANSILAGCEATAVHNSGGARGLTATEMDQTTVGSASAAIDVATLALPPAVQTTASASTLVVSGSNPVANPPFLAYPSSTFSTLQGAASATSGKFAETNGSSHISVSSATEGVRLDAAGTGAAAGGEASYAQLNMQFYGLNIGRTDLVFGTATANACCAPFLKAHVTASGGAAGPYSMELQGSPLSDMPGQAQSRVDIAIASSAVPIVDPGLVMGLRTARGSPIF